MDKIRVDNGTRRIEVNDSGEFIELPMADQMFTKRFFELLDIFQHKAKEIESDSLHFEKLTEKEKLDYSIKVHTDFKEGTDKLFGEGTCKKVFGDILPAADMYIDLFEQLTPFFEKYGRERSAKISKKYNVSRAGNV
jgi:plasmid maintenance system killer protein